MLPPLAASGWLPPGIHEATLDAVDARFGRASVLRRVQMESVRWLVDLARRAGIKRVVLNGSFVSDIMEPNDVDCVLLMPRGRVQDAWALRELRAGLPFIDSVIVRSIKRFDEYVRVILGTDRAGTPKGVVEVMT